MQKCKLIDKKSNLSSFCHNTLHIPISTKSDTALQIDHYCKLYVTSFTNRSFFIQEAITNSLTHQNAFEEFKQATNVSYGIIFLYP